MKTHPLPLVGCAGWSLPVPLQNRFADEGTHLERYASRLPAVEINSSFYRPHQAGTYARWSASVPDAFRFSVKVPKSITHEHRLQNTEPLLEAFMGQAGTLGERLGCLLVQLPPSLAFDAEMVGKFFESLASMTATPAVCEPRHFSWFTGEADRLLAGMKVARVAADPSPGSGGGEPGGWRGLSYYRLHGSPRIYYSTYSHEFLERLAEKMRMDRPQGKPIWCIFDNTAQGEAIPNALDFLGLVGDRD